MTEQQKSVQKKEVPTEITSDEGNADTVIGTGMAMSSAMATSVPTPQIEINARAVLKRPIHITAVRLLNQKTAEE